nr:uncharacterized protein LOC112748212 [Arachis hypogaea]
MLFQSKIAVITGGDFGIGRAVCNLFALEGAPVAFTYVKGQEDKDAKDKRNDGVEGVGSDAGGSRDNLGAWNLLWSGKLKEIEPRELKEIETNPPSFFPQFITLAPIVAAVGSLLAPPPSQALRTSSLSSLASPFVEEDLSLHLLRRRHRRLHRCLSSHCYLGELRAAIKAPRITSTNLISVRGTIERYKKASAASSNTESVSEANTQFYQQESSKLRRQIRDIQNLNRHILGEALSSLSLKELKNLESRLEKGLSRVRSRKEDMM